MTQVWYYVKVRRADDGTWLGWLGWSPQGFLRFNGPEKDDKGNPVDPSKLSDVTYVNELSGTPTYLRAPDYHQHGSASLGGADTNGYYAAWKWGEESGYKMTVDGRGIVKDTNGRTLSVYWWAGSADASWETLETEAVKFEFAVRKET
jgi:hypothetical protein